MDIVTTYTRLRGVNKINRTYFESDLYRVFFSCELLRKVESPSFASWIINKSFEGTGRLEYTESRGSQRTPASEKIQRYYSTMTRQSSSSSVMVRFKGILSFQLTSSDHVEITDHVQHLPQVQQKSADSLHTWCIM